MRVADHSGVSGLSQSWGLSILAPPQFDDCLLIGSDCTVSV